MTPAALLHQRLVHQGLARSPWRTPAEAVTALGAVQAQDFGMAKWALGLRVPGSDEAKIEQAFNAGHFLRTHVLRPTWHFVAPADLRWLLALTTPRIHAAAAGPRRQLGLDAAVFRRSEKVLARVLAGGRALDRHALEAALRHAGVNTANPRLPHLLMHAELEGLIVSGPREGGRFTYMLLDARVPPQPPRSHNEAVTELARRYFQTRAPATVRDFAWWSGLTLRDARAGAAALGPDFTTATIGDTRFIVPAVPARTTGAYDDALLLPAYDEYVVAYAQRDALFPQARPAPSAQVASSVLGPSLLVHGRVTGIWRRLSPGRTGMIEVSPTAPLRVAGQRALDRATRRYRRFLGQPAALVPLTRPCPPDASGAVPPSATPSPANVSSRRARRRR